VVDNGEQAVAAFVAQPPDQPFDLVFMDIQMPVLDGFAAARRLRAHELPLGRHTPILAMTAHAMEGYRERCLAGGMDGYVTKPVEHKQLVQEMCRVLKLVVL
jgi:CheY-like chemotaxis protein